MGPILGDEVAGFLSAGLAAAEEAALGMGREGAELELEEREGVLPEPELREGVEPEEEDLRTAAGIDGAEALGRASDGDA